MIRWYGNDRLHACLAYVCRLECDHAKNASNLEPNLADASLFQRLRRELKRQIEDYVYEVPESAIGNPLPAKTISNYLESMRYCLVEPRWEEANICTPKESVTGTGVKRMCITMAEEGSYVLIYDATSKEYHLAWRSADGLSTWGIHGSGADCFIAR